jgi:hypothetical protein
MQMDSQPLCLRKVVGIFLCILAVIPVFGIMSDYAAIDELSYIVITDYTTD